MSKGKLAALFISCGGFVMALGLNCLPNIGGDLLDQLGISGLLDQLTG